MRYICLLSASVVTSFFCSFQADAQAVKSRFQLKLYSFQDVRWTTVYGQAGQYQINSDVKLFRPSLGLNYSFRSGWFTEIELNGFSSRRSTSLTESSPVIVSEGRFISMGARLELGRNIRHSRNGLWQIGYSGAVRPVFTRETCSPDPESGKYINNRSLNTDIQFIPRFQRRLTNRISLDLNLPLTLAQIRAKNHISAMPLQCIPDTERSVKADVLPAVLNFRVGLSFKF